jgi:hypothetical protein
VELNILPDCYIEQSTPVLIRKISDFFQLFGSQVTTGNSNADHEEAIAGWPLGVEPKTSKARQDIVGYGPGLKLGTAIQVRDDVRQHVAGWLFKPAHD